MRHPLAALLLLPPVLLACRAEAPADVPVPDTATAAVPPAAPTLAPADTAGLAQAAQHYMRGEGVVPGRVTFGAFEGGYARVLVAPLDLMATDPATVYLQHDAKGWRGLSYGTGFSPEELDGLGIPASVRQ